MNGPATAREALIAEALGDVARLLDRIESLRISMEAARQTLEQADAQRAERLKAFDAGTSTLTQRAKLGMAQYIAHCAAEATRQSIEAQSRALHEAARLAFTQQFDPTMARFTALLRQLVQRADRRWDHWLTHAATAAASVVLTAWGVLLALK